MWCTVHLREEMSLTEFCLVDMGTVGRDHNFDQYRHFFLRPKKIYIETESFYSRPNYLMPIPDFWVQKRSNHAPVHDIQEKNLHSRQKYINRLDLT